MPSLLTATMFLSRTFTSNYTTLHYTTCGPVVLPCMKILHAYTTQRCTHPVTIQRQSGNSNTLFCFSTLYSFQSDHKLTLIFRSFFEKKCCFLETKVHQNIFINVSRLQSSSIRHVICGLQ
jgi:hypothetical protein